MTGCTSPTRASRPRRRWSPTPPTLSSTASTRSRNNTAQTPASSALPRVELSDRPYGLRAGDEVIFTAAFYPPGEPRVENGTLGNVASVDGPSEIAVQTRGALEREVHVDTAESQDMRLAYAQHVYKAQGVTVGRAFVLTGGWQTDREPAYVALRRAREQTDIYVSREDLGEQGMDTGAIERLGDTIAASARS
jgi:ATP-dependent exoDNAse (exonuclease V) alpha subunit